jgi:hypothetical protein
LIEFNPSSENDCFFNDCHQSSAIETLRNRSNSNHANASHRQSPVVVEVETKWVLSVLVEACVCIAAISSYAVVMVSHQQNLFNDFSHSCKHLFANLWIEC